MSPVCSTNAGRCGKRVDPRSTAAWSVAVTSVLASLLKPMWLSLICAKNSPDLPAVPASAVPAFPRAADTGTPPTMLHNTALPAHAMQVRKPRRSTPSAASMSSLMYFAFAPIAPVAPVTPLSRSPTVPPRPIAYAAARHVPKPPPHVLWMR